ncbi:RNA polymerase factor sigma-54 [Aquincola sp. MAHUQ-54]|uniref:RNA polymerase sigma-54 factor n=1 Tax=Aquincola agrisoli TaxID=3119538 RepID=A0AAW9QBR8_9BURK
MTALHMRIERRQTQTVTPRLQHAVRLLQLSSMDFAQEVQQALDGNPFLEEEADEAPQAADGGDVAAPPWEAQAWTVSAGGGSTGSADSDVSLIDLLPQSVSLRQHLHTQLNVMPLSERDRALAAMIVESLDDDGYLRQALEDLCALAELDPPTGIGEMRVALCRVQALDPLGVGARDLAECLQLQTVTIEDAHQRALARRILAQPLQRLAMREFHKLATLVDASPAEVEAVCERIRQFDPRPGGHFDAARTPYVTPDVIVRRGRGQNWITTLNPEVVPRVRLNRLYADLFQRHRDTGQTDLAAHLREARWTLRNVEQRFATILDVSNAIVRHQRHFFEYGPMAMKPLALRDIAQEVGLHESTVCRVTNNKYMATPSGVFELKYFFSRALPTQSGGQASTTAIRGVIRELIDEESPAQPLSDVQLAALLKRQGFHVARRTVTKYRQQLKLPAVEQRRQRAAAPAMAGARC